ncbi:MAG: flagellar export protein FliJ [Candidatus Baltobacteraceae bacterium]
MKRFAFSLEPVLEQRERIEDEKQLFLAGRMRDLRDAQDTLARLNAQFKQYSLRLRDGHRNFTSEDLRAHYAHLEYLDRSMTMQHGIISQCRLASERARLDLLDASRERKVIEKLKERRFEEHRQMQAAEEQRELDDSNNRRHARAHAAT